MAFMTSINNSLSEPQTKEKLLSAEPLLSDLPPMNGATLFKIIKNDSPPPTITPELLRKLEQLREEPITFLNLDAIPCREISDDTVRRTKPLVSVVVVTYNHEKYISQTLDGILRQKTDFPFEVVIGDDCSTDQTRQIALDYQQKYPDRVRVLFSDHNLFQSGSSNSVRTLLASRGDYIAFCEGDDYWIDDEKLQKQVHVFQTHPNVTAVFTGGYHLFQKTGRIVPRPIHLLNGEVDMRDRLHTLLTKPLYQQHRFCSSAFRRSIFERRYSEDPLAYIRLTAGDRQLWIFCALCGTLYYLNDLTSVYRRHETSITGSLQTKNTVSRDVKIINLFYMVDRGIAAFYSRNTRRFVAGIIHANGNQIALRKEKKGRFLASYGPFLRFMCNRSIPFLFRIQIWYYLTMIRVIRRLQRVKTVYVPVRFVWCILFWKKKAEWQKEAEEDDFICF